MELMDGLGVRGYVSEPDRGRRRWKDKQAARRRIRGERGRALPETGGMRRTWLQGHANILERDLVQVAAFKLGIVMRQVLGAGTPRDLAAMQALLQQLIGLAMCLSNRLGDCLDCRTMPCAWPLRSS
jgi:transposase